MHNFVNSVKTARGAAGVVGSQCVLPASVQCHVYLECLERLQLLESASGRRTPDVGGAWLNG